MRKIRVLILSAAVISAVMLTHTACSGGGEQITIRFATFAVGETLEGEPTCPVSASKIFFRREIENRTNGRIIVSLFPDGQLGSTVEEKLFGLLNGSIDIVALYHGGWGGVTHAFAGFSVPYLFSSYEEVWAVLDSDIGESWKRQVYEDTGVLPMPFFDAGFRHLTNSVHSITCPDDLIGIRLRTMPDGLHAATWEALGADVTPMPWVGLLTALPHGLIDAQENTIVNIVQAGLYEYQSYLTITNHMYTAIIPAVSPLFWDSLSAGDKELISQVMLEAQEAGRQKALIAEEKYMRYLADTGVLVTELTAEQFQEFQAAARAVWPMIADIMGQSEFERLVNFVSALRN